MNGDLFNLPAGPVSFALGGEYRGERYENTPDSLNTTFNTIGSTDLEASRVNRDVWGFYQEVRIPVTSPTWNFPGAYSLEFDLAEREEWYSQNTAATSVVGAGHSQFDTQRPKFSVRWQPLDQELTVRASYSEGFHAPSLFEISPASTQSFPAVTDPHNPKPLGGGLLPSTPPNNPTDVQVEEVQIGNPNLQPEVAYEWSYGLVYSPKWLKGLTISADWWHIDMRSIAALLGSQFILDHESSFPGLVTRAPAPPGFVGPVTLIIDPNANLGGAVLEGLDYEIIYILDTSIFGHGASKVCVWIDDEGDGPNEPRRGSRTGYEPRKRAFMIENELRSQNRCNRSHVDMPPIGAYGQALEPFRAVNRSVGPFIGNFRLQVGISELALLHLHISRSVRGCGRQDSAAEGLRDCVDR